MKIYSYLTTFAFVATASTLVAGCTKLNENLTSSLSTTEANEFSPLFLQGAYNDIGVIYEDPSNENQMEEMTADETFIPVRGSDWADGGEHVAFHLHAWTRQDGTTALLQTTFQTLNKMNYDATAVLGTDGTADQLAQARFIRAFALYQLLDLYGQFPFRQPGDNLLLASKVYTGDSAVQFIESELNQCITNLNPANATSIANPDAARMLLMKVLLNRGAFDNRANPTFADADMQQVITLGQTIMSNSAHSLDPNYFDIFSPSNSNNSEAIFSLPNSHSANTTLSTFSNMKNRWYATLHYNMYTPLNPDAGWNGFSTMGEFYNTFGVNGVTPTQTISDTTLDSRLGNKYVAGVTDISGIRPGILINQQYDQNGVAEQDRLGNPLSFTNAEEVPATIDVTGLPSIETAGYRIIKYAPDYSTGTASYGVPSNYFMLLRYSDVLLMLAEAELREASPNPAGALALVNQLRAARQAPPLTTMALVNSTNVYDPNTLLAERGRELYWENQRRTDLIRFGVWTIPWRLKPADNGNYFLFPIDAQDLAANPNLFANLQGSKY
jgi:starch-binding outer membrane protein, SusD/RagB family